MTCSAFLVPAISLMIASLLQERKKLLQCSCCGKLVHAACLVPPMTDLVSGDWSCHSCNEKTEEYLQARHAYVTELLKRFMFQKFHPLCCRVFVAVQSCQTITFKRINTRIIILMPGMKQLWSVSQKYWR